MAMTEYQLVQKELLRQQVLEQLKQLQHLAETNVVIDDKFLLNAKSTYPSIKRKNTKKQIIFTVDILVPKYDEIRKIKIVFKHGLFDHPKVFSDGSKESKHRYPDNSLCMWYPEHSSDYKWIHSDGLLHLLAHIQLHLFREAYWREFGEWVGFETEH